MKRGIISLLTIVLSFVLLPSIAWATDEEVNEAFEKGDLVIVPNWEKLPGGENNPDVKWPGEEALDNWYSSEEVDYDTFNYVYDVYYKGEKVDPKTVWTISTTPTSTFCEPSWNEETQQFDPVFNEDGLGAYRIDSVSFDDNGSIKAPIKGSLSAENVATISTWRLVPFDLTNSDRVRIAYDGTWNNNEESVPYTGETYPLTFKSTWEGIENPMYTVYWTDANGNEIVLDKGYDYAGRAMNNKDATENPTDLTTWAKPILLGVYNFYGKFIPSNGDFYIKGDSPDPSPAPEPEPSPDPEPSPSPAPEPKPSPNSQPIPSFEPQNASDVKPVPQSNNKVIKEEKLKQNIANDFNVNKLPETGDILYSIRISIVIIALAAGIIALALHRKNKKN